VKFGVEQLAVPLVLMLIVVYFQSMASFRMYMRG
jgi:hypothetical protein